MKHPICFLFGHKWETTKYNVSYNIHYSSGEELNHDGIMDGVVCRRCNFLFVPKLTNIYKKLNNEEIEATVHLIEERKNWNE